MGLDEWQKDERNIERYNTMSEIMAELMFNDFQEFTSEDTGTASSCDFSSTRRLVAGKFAQLQI